MKKYDRHNHIPLLPPSTCGTEPLVPAPHSARTQPQTRAAVLSILHLEFELPSILPSSYNTRIGAAIDLDKVDSTSPYQHLGSFPLGPHSHWLRLANSDGYIKSELQRQARAPVRLLRRLSSAFLHRSGRAQRDKLATQRAARAINAKAAIFAIIPEKLFLDILLSITCLDDVLAFSNSCRELRTLLWANKQAWFDRYFPALPPSPDIWGYDFCYHVRWRARAAQVLQIEDNVGVLQFMNRDIEDKAPAPPWVIRARNMSIWCDVLPWMLRAYVVMKDTPLNDEEIHIWFWTFQDVNEPQYCPLASTNYLDEHPNVWTVELQTRFSRICFRGTLEQRRRRMEMEGKEKIAKETAKSDAGAFLRLQERWEEINRDIVLCQQLMRNRITYIDELL
ncbi:hypothetical protein HDU86_001239 [Geranomyces michiganensis]|nr:hypothetical protein HDU86_001239 [Geranomyces michiganensis]